MSTIPQYVQCYLKSVDKTSMFQTAWIEARGAIPGAQVELLTVDDGPQLWEVVRAFAGVRIPKDVLKETQRQRRVGLPSIRDTEKDKRQQAGL